MHGEDGKSLPVALTVAGSDSGGGAGIQADLLTFASLGVFGTSAITCLTAQNPAGVTGVFPVSAAFVSQQLAQVASYFQLGAVKTGMLFNAEIIGAVSAFLRAKPDLPAVVDPVMVATSGASLLEPEAVARLLADLLPLARLITPNLDEVRVLTNRRPTLISEMRRAGEELAERFRTAVLVKGGHLETKGEIVDVLVEADGTVTEFRHSRIFGVNTHGSGCTLASAIAAHLARGEDLRQAVEEGLDYLAGSLHGAIRIGGERFLAH